MSLIPEVGIYHDVSFEKYLSWDAISNSRLKLAKRSMAHYRWSYRSEESPALETLISKEMQFGTLCHAGKFEPSVISERYVVLPDFELYIRKPNGKEYDNPKQSAAYKAEKAEFLELPENVGKTVITRAEWDKMLAVCLALSKSSRAEEFLAVRFPFTKLETAIVWDDPYTGLRCKGRMDAWQTDRDVVGDLKTTQDVRFFERAIGDRAYHRQAAFYIDGLHMLTGAIHKFGLVAIESDRPYGVQAAPLSDRSIQIGRREYQRLLAQIKQCEDSGDWPGYTSPDSWEVPEWAAWEADTFAVEDGKITSW